MKLNITVKNTASKPTKTYEGGLWLGYKNVGEKNPVLVLVNEYAQTITILEPRSFGTVGDYFGEFDSNVKNVIPLQGSVELRNED